MVPFLRPQSRIKVKTRGTICAVYERLIKVAMVVICASLQEQLSKSLRSFEGLCSGGRSHHVWRTPLYIDILKHITLSGKVIPVLYKHQIINVYYIHGQGGNYFRVVERYMQIFMSLIVVYAFRFGLYRRQLFNGWWAFLSFFSCKKTSSGFTLRQPTSK